MTQRTIEEKYAFLLKHLVVTDVDLWENDALIQLEKPIYFQFATNAHDIYSADFAVEQAMGNHFTGPTDN